MHSVFRQNCMRGKYGAGIIFLVLVFGFVIPARTQDRCGTVEYTKIQETNAIHEDKVRFEKWITQRKFNVSSRANAEATFSIPVVVHVIHNGEPVGSGTNISDAQILSQIKVLNNDFKRLNADTVNTPTEFLSLAGRFNVEFVLAKQSPDGMSTNGILRVKGTRTQWSMNDDRQLKRLSYWPAEDYMNIWITDIASSILGYAQFPVSDLPGLEDPDNNRLTDGIVLDYRIVGSNQDGSFNLTESFNRGRTATHEVGHFFGLRHIWGDDEGACSGSGDYVDDTPDQGNSSDGCPSHPLISCNTRNMFQNYMDYTNDVCMNLYTNQQVERMLTVLNNSPRRASLTTSKGLYDPVPVNNDLAIVGITSPAPYECGEEVVPAIRVRNVGLNDAMSAKIRLSAGDVFETKEITFLPVKPGEETEVLFAPLALSPGSTDISFEILETNSTADGKPLDNSRSILTEVPDRLATPFSQNFDIFPQSWNIINEDGSMTWAIASTGAVGGAANTALVMQYFRSDDDAGEQDIIVTPIIDLSTATSPFLAFDVAYGRYLNRSDGLQIYALQDCNIEMLSGDVIYKKQGDELATVASANSSFSPANENQWRREVIDLRQYIGQSHVQFAFVGLSDNGNNLYIDNVAVRPDVSENLVLLDVLSPSPVHCNREVQPSLLIENRGSLPVNSLKVVYFANDTKPRTVSIANDLVLAPGSRTTIDLPAIEMNDSANTLSFELTYPNGFFDIDSSDNTLRINSIVNGNEDKIPLRQNFDGNSEDPWEVVNPKGDKNWETIPTNYGQSLYFDGESATNDLQRSWLVSPVLDFSNATNASLFFDISYYSRGIDSIKDPSEEVFMVIASRDCGKTFDDVLFTGNGTSLSEGNRQGDWVPKSAPDWKNIYLNLNALAGERNIRIAFVVSTGITNDLFLDNVEFFLSDDPSPAAIPDLYMLYPNRLDSEKSFYVTFNLPDRQQVAYELVDMTGKQVGSKELPDVLNQTYRIDVESASSGIYLVRLLIDNKYYVSKIVVVQ